MLGVLYAATVYGQLRPLRGNWEPARPLELGDYGRLDGMLFDKRGNLRDLGFQLPKPEISGGDGYRQFTSSGSIQVDFKARAKVKAADALEKTFRLEVSFGREQGVFLNAAGCTISALAQKTEIETYLKAQMNAAQSTWDKQWVVVTDLCVARRTLIAIAGASGGKFVADVSANAKGLADGSANFSLRPESNVGYHVMESEPLPLFYGVCGLRRKFLRSGEVLMLFSSDGSGRVSPDVAVEEHPDELEFLQIE